MRRTNASNSLVLDLTLGPLARLRRQGGPDGVRADWTSPPSTPAPGSCSTSRAQCTRWKPWRRNTRPRTPGSRTGCLGCAGSRRARPVSAGRASRPRYRRARAGPPEQPSPALCASMARIASISSSAGVSAACRSTRQHVVEPAALGVVELVRLVPSSTSRYRSRCNTASSKSRKPGSSKCCAGASTGPP